MSVEKRKLISKERRVAAGIERLSFVARAWFPFLPLATTHVNAEFPYCYHVNSHGSKQHRPRQEEKGFSKTRIALLGCVFVSGGKYSSGTQSVSLARL